MDIQGIFDRRREARKRYGGSLLCDRYKCQQGEVFLTIADDFLFAELGLQTARADKELKAYNYKEEEVKGFYPVFVQTSELDEKGIEYRI